MEYLTLEELFYNNEELSSWEILQWLRFKHNRQHIEPHEINTVVGLYKGWKDGLFKVSGDMVELRDWSGN